MIGSSADDVEDDKQDDQLVPGISDLDHDSLDDDVPDEDQLVPAVKSKKKFDVSCVQTSDGKKSRIRLIALSFKSLVVP
jgi:hypothetical protein